MTETDIPSSGGRDRAASLPPLEIWAGPECTIVRIGDRWRDQAAETGHRIRKDDIDRIAGLGVKTVRYPILWESVAPERPDRLDFGWTDERLGMLEARGIEVVAGLLHHGSGPSYTDLLDPDFPAKFADYAAKVAERYPRIGKWTPINEPLTTARFSALYGHWYPHRRDYPAFLRALVNQCSGIRAAMAAIRARNPGAALIQTEDLGKTFATGPLRHQAEHENERRWLSLDLLAGRVDATHPLYRFLVDAGIGPDELAAFEDGAATPDMIGINHYLTSERFLDHRAHLYPGLAAGGNGRDAYVDAEAARVEGLDGDIGIGARLREAWARYRIPMAITETHHGCTRDEQLRWLAETWGAAEQVREEGVDLRSLTLWSAFGNVDWRSLLTRDEGVYDAGAFDIRSPNPRPTVVAKAAAAFAQRRAFDHPVLDTPGWWRRGERFYARNGPGGRPPSHPGRTLLITGATGTLGGAFERIARHRGLAFKLTGRAQLDICDERSIAAAIERHRPWAIVNAAGFVRVADAERERGACMAANADGPERLAEACAAAGIPLVAFSSDLVFEGLLGRACRESDEVNPAGAYGISKAEAERRMLATGANALVVRTSAFFGPWDTHNFAWSVIDALRHGAEVRASATTFVSPTFVPDLCHAALDLLIDGETGIWHLANQGEISWYEFARVLAEAAGLDVSLVIPERDAAPRNTALASERGAILRPLLPAIHAFLGDLAEREEVPIAAE